MKPVPTRPIRFPPDGKKPGVTNCPPTNTEAVVPFYRLIYNGDRQTVGVWYYAIGTDRDGVEYLKKPVKLADPFAIVGHGQDENSIVYRIIEFPSNDRIQQQAVPLGSSADRTVGSCCATGASASLAK